MEKIYKGDGLDLIDLFYSVTPELEVDIAKWQWKYLNNPLKENLIAIYEENGKIISQEAIVPLNFYYKGNIVKVGHSVDSMTLKEHRGKGIFKKLALLTLKEGKDRRYSFFYGFPNPNSKPIYLNKLNWKLVGNIRRWIFPLNLNFLSTKINLNFSFFNPLFKIGKGMIKYKDKYDKVNNFSEVYDYSNYIYKNYDMFILRDENFLNWRYLNHPYYKYDIFRNTDNLFVLRIKNIDIKRGTIEEFLIKDEKSFIDTLNFSIKYFLDNNVDLVDIWIKEGDPLEKILIKKGFIPYNKKPIIIYPFDDIDLNSKYFLNFSDLDII
ncbi:MAG: GNAT family N-acetyltransferase [Caldisericia bacterium]